MSAARPLIAGVLLGLGIPISTSSALKIELNEIVNPALAFATDQPYRGRDLSCDPEGCKGILTRDGSTSDGSRWGCTQQELGTFTSTCTVHYEMDEESYAGDSVTLSSMRVAFQSDSKTTISVWVDDSEVISSWTGDEGTTSMQEIPGLSGITAEEVEFQAIMDEGEYMGILEVEIYVEVDDVPVSGASASEHVSVTVSATVNDGDAANTLDGSTSDSSSWSCSDGDTCEITYDLQTVQSMEQLRVAFMETSATEGATFNLYTAGVDGVFSPALEGVTAGARDSSIVGMQTFGGIRKLARYVKIEGVPGSGGQFAITEVDVRVGEDAPSYPTTQTSSLIPVGLIPLGADAGSNAGVPYDPRPASEGGCSAGHLEGCSVYNIKDGDDSDESRWSCSPMVDTAFSGTCLAQFDLNTNRYLRQIQLAYYKGAQRHNEFSVRARTEGGWVVVIPSAISSGDTEDYQTWDLSVYTNAIQLLPRFGGVREWSSIKEMVLLEKKQSSNATPILSYYNSEGGFSFDLLPSSDLKKKFSFDLDNVGDEGRIYVGGEAQTAKVRAVKMKFPKNKSFTFDITYYIDDETEISTTFTSAGGAKTWEKFSFPETVTLEQFRVVAVSGPDIEDYPTLRVVDFKALGKPYTPGVKYVVSTTIEEWNVVPDYIGDGKGDQEEIMTAICDGIGQGFDGTDCDGVTTGTAEATDVNMVMGDYYLDGPVFLKSDVNLLGIWSEDDSPYETTFIMHGSGTGADGIINALGVSNIIVEEVHVYSNLDSAGVAGTVGNVCMDISDASNISVDTVSLSNCPEGGLRVVDTDTFTGSEFYGGGSAEGNEAILKGVTDFTLYETQADGMVIEDSSNVLIEARIDDGDFYGSIRVPDGGDQSANLVVSGTTEGVTLKNIQITEGAVPRVVLENSNPLTIDGVTVSGGNSGDCVIEFPEGADGNAILVQLNMETDLVLSGNCFELA